MKANGKREETPTADCCLRQLSQLASRMSQLWLEGGMNGNQSPIPQEGNPQTEKALSLAAKFQPSLDLMKQDFNYNRLDTTGPSYLRAPYPRTCIAHGWRASEDIPDVVGRHVRIPCRSPGLAS